MIALLAVIIVKSIVQSLDYKFYTRIYSQSILSKYIFILLLYSVPFLPSFLPFIDSCTTSILNHRAENRTILIPQFYSSPSLWRTPPLESLSGQKGGMKSLIAAGQERVWEMRDEDGCWGIIRMGRGPRGVNAEQLRSA